MSEPTPPGVQAPPPPELRDATAAKEPPLEVKRVRTLYTATAAFLVFIAVMGLFLLKDQERALRQAISKSGNADAMAALEQPGLIRGALILVTVVILVVAIGHGLAAQGLRDRKSWARPVGFTFSGILLGVAVLFALSGGINIQSIFFFVAGLSGILGLAKPEVRDYLKPWPKHVAPPVTPHGQWPPQSAQGSGADHPPNPSRDGENHQN